MLLLLWKKIFNLHLTYASFISHLQYELFVISPYKFWINWNRTNWRWECCSDLLLEVINLFIRQQTEFWYSMTIKQEQKANSVRFYPYTTCLNTSFKWLGKHEFSMKYTKRQIKRSSGSTLHTVSIKNQWTLSNTERDWGSPPDIWQAPALSVWANMVQGKFSVWMMWTLMEHEKTISTLLPETEQA